MNPVMFKKPEIHTFGTAPTKAYQVHEVDEWADLVDAELSRLEEERKEAETLRSEAEIKEGAIRTKFDAISYLLRVTCGNCFWMEQAGCAPRLARSRAIINDDERLTQIVEDYWENPENQVCEGFVLRGFAQNYNKSLYEILKEEEKEKE